MMRYILVGFLLSLSASVQAGFYAGAQIGQDFSTYNENAWLAEFELDGLSLSGFANGLYGGYRFSGEKYFWGLELNFSRSEAYFSEKAMYLEPGQTVKDQYRISVGNGHGAAFIWGGNLGGADLYGRLGWQMTELVSSVTDQGVTEKESFDLGGVRIGLGSELPLSERLRLRLDWTYTIYMEEDYDGYDVIFDVVQSLFMVGLTFRI